MGKVKRINSTKCAKNGKQLESHILLTAYMDKTTLINYLALSTQVEYDPEIPLIGIKPKKKKVYLYISNVTEMFIAALVMIIQNSHHSKSIQQ